MDLASPFRYATPADAVALAELVQLASEGLALYLWSQVAPPGVDPWEIGRERAACEATGASGRAAVVAEADGRIAAVLIGCPLDPAPAPVPTDLPPMAVPLRELENLAPGTWQVNVLAAYSPYRGRGYGTALLGIAERLAREARSFGMSLITSDANTGARRLYARCGYREVASRPMVKQGWRHPGTRFVLLTKPLLP